MCALDSSLFKISFRSLEDIIVNFFALDSDVFVLVVMQNMSRETSVSLLSVPCSCHSDCLKTLIEIV